MPAQKDAFIRDIELAIGSYRGGVEFSQNTKPKKVRAALVALEKKATVLLQAKRRLDKYSLDLLDQQGRGPNRTVPIITEQANGSIAVGVDHESRAGFSAHQAFVAVGYLREHARSALATTNLFRGTKLIDWPGLNLAMEVAAALQDILKIKPTTDPNNRFSAVLNAALSIAKAGTSQRQTHDVSRLARNALNLWRAEQPHKFHKQ